MLYSNWVFSSEKQDSQAVRQITIYYNNHGSPVLFSLSHPDTVSSRSTTQATVAGSQARLPMTTEQPDAKQILGNWPIRTSRAVITRSPSLTTMLGLYVTMETIKFKSTVCAGDVTSGTESIHTTWPNSYRNFYLKYKQTSLFYK